MHKLSPEELESLHNDCLNDSTNIIRYLEKKLEEQDKQSKIDRIINIISVVLAGIAAIASIASFFIWISHSR